jgi:GSH-dependent disulfide-bond oxidoreductase
MRLHPWWDVNFTTEAAVDLYTLGTPNGQKVSIALEEMGLKYTVHKIDISKGDQFTADYVKVNPNSKIPALVDGEHTLFESVAIMIYLAEKTGQFLPKDPVARYQTLCWSVFQAAGVGPMFGQFGHFSVYAPEKIPYAIERYRKECDRLMTVLDVQLKSSKYLACDEYTIADMATWPWVRGYQVFYKTSIDAEKFPHLMRWYAEIEKRPAVQRGLKVPE